MILYYVYDFGYGYLAFLYCFFFLELVRGICVFIYLGI